MKEYSNITTSFPSSEGNINRLACVLYVLTAIYSGNFSVVKLAMRKDTGEYFAVKVINKRKFWHIPKTREQIVREVEVLKTIKHVNIISYLEIYDTEDTLYIVLEL